MKKQRQITPLDDQQLASTAALKQWFDQVTTNAHADNTQRAYARQLAAFTAWKGQADITPLTVLSYIKHLNEQGKSIATIDQALAAISHSFSQSGQVSPCAHPQVKQALKALHKIAARNTKRKQAKPLSLALVEEHIAPMSCDHTYQAARNKALILAGFFGAFRRSELANLRWQNITETDEGLAIEVIGTKTGTVQKTLFYRSNSEACPVVALKALRKRSEHAQNSDHVFQSVRKGNNQTGHGISDRSVDTVIKNTFGDDFSGHSMRAGFVTSARRAGVTYDDIMKQTGHKTLQEVKDYARGIDNAQNNAAKGL